MCVGLECNVTLALVKNIATRGQLFLYHVHASKFVKAKDESAAVRALLLHNVKV